jgi:hypothetical protein
VSRRQPGPSRLLSVTQAPSTGRLCDVHVRARSWMLAFADTAHVRAGTGPDTAWTTSLASASLLRRTHSQRATSRRTSEVICAAAGPRPRRKPSDQNGYARAADDADSHVP